MSPAEVSRLRSERSGVDWSAGETEFGVSAVAADAIATARRRLSQSLSASNRAHAKGSTSDLLRALGVMNSKGRLLRAGAILFCDDPSPAIVYQYRNTPAGEAKAVERLAFPLITTFERALELISARRNATNLTLPDGHQIVIDDFPELAVRETLANAVIHRDYQLKTAVSIEHSPDLLAVSSPGPLVSGVTPQNILTHPSLPRNACLANACRVLGMAEETGRGVDRIFREMIRVGRTVPSIEDFADHVRVRLFGGAPNTQVAKFVAQLPGDEREDTDTLLVLFTLCSKRTTTAADLATILQKPKDETEQVLRRLSAEPPGIIEATRSTARLSYPTYRLRNDALKQLGGAVPYHARTTDDIDRKVAAHVVEYGTITNRTVQNLLDVGLTKARNILADLVQRDVLKKVSQHERGPRVEYGPGKQFPKAKPPNSPRSSPPPPSRLKKK